MVHAHEGLVGRPGKTLGKCHAHDECAHKARALRDGDGGQVMRGKHGAQAERLARLLHGLQVDAHNGLGVLARGNLGHDAAEAGVEVNLSGDDVGDDFARAVDDGHGRLVAAALNRQNEFAGRLESLGLLGRALRIDGRPRAGARLGAGLDVGVGGGVFERKLRGHDARTHARGVVVGANALLNITKTLVEALGGGVAHLNLERGGCSPEHLGVVGDAAHEARGDALASTLGGNGDVCNLQLAVHDGTARIAHDGAAVMRHPPDVAGKRNVVVERALRPGRVVGIGKDSRLERRHGSDVVDAHGAQLQVDVAQGVVDAAHAHAFGLGHAQADALVFLGVGQARVDRQDKRGVASLGGIEALRRQACAQKALAAGIPGLLGGKAGKARLLVERAVLGDAVSGKHDVAGVGTTGPQGHGVGDLHHRLAGKQAMGALVVDAIETGVDLLAHGIAHDAHEAAHAAAPHAPGHGVERGGAVQRDLKAARDTLGSRHTDAHAREGARARAREHRVDLVALHAALGKHAVNHAHELLVCMSAAHLVGAGDHLQATGAPRLVDLHATQSTSQHVGRGVNGQNVPCARGALLYSIHVRCVPFVFVLPQRPMAPSLVSPSLQGKRVALKRMGKLGGSRARCRQFHHARGLGGVGAHGLARDAHLKMLVAQFLGKHLRPLYEAGAVVLKSLEHAHILKLVGALEPVEVEVEQRHAPGVMDAHDLKRRARDGARVAQPGRHASREARLARTEVAGEKDDVAGLKGAAQRLTKSAHGL